MCVLLTKGLRHQKNLNENPLEVAKRVLKPNGITHLHLVDLDGAKKVIENLWKLLLLIPN